ncbi:hypothetical protein OIU84_002065 [Salix udensis]|uniref:1-phosphatidylinositol 4-kinase n=1 Tax=Salix udensis TaxID=889485 RepID=A0AAD6P6L6_9ROSI|nr:hypothetical protein OIU84_002065 [Salix udensis]
MSVAVVAVSPVHEASLDSRCNFPWLGGLRSNDSIVIFLADGGSVIPMRVMESDSIASVKLRIQASKGIFVKKQKLVFEGRELARGNSQVRDYGVADGKVLHLVLRLSDLQAITVRTVCGKVYEFHVDRGRSVGYVKKQIARRGKGFDLVEQELICDGEELEDQRLITDICKSNDSVIHLLIRKSAKVRVKPVEKDFELCIEALDLNDKEVDNFLLEPLIVNTKIQLPLVIRELIKSTLNGLERGNEPIRSSEGSGGAYFMQDSSGLKYVSVFKPIDEEPMALSFWIIQRVDRAHFLMFMENNGSCEDMGPRAFPVAEVHKISVLDIRLANADRHAGNILVSKDGERGKIVLIPIDHGYCLPTNFEDCTFDWLYWPQAQQPYSPDTVEYIKALDAGQDIALLKFHGWDIPPEVARTLHISTMLLKKGVERGLTPSAIGSIMCRETLKKESVIEQIVQEARDVVLPGSSEAAFLEAVSLIMDRRLDKL